MVSAALIFCKHFRGWPPWCITRAAAASAGRSARPMQEHRDHSSPTQWVKPEREKDDSPEMQWDTRPSLHNVMSDGDEARTVVHDAIGRWRRERRAIGSFPD